MEVKESFRILELQIGASRADVEAAYLRLLEQWHPGRAAAKGPEAVREAQKKIQAINEAYNLLIAVAPETTQPPMSPLPTMRPAAAASAAAEPPSASTPRPTINKPKLTPMSTGQPEVGRPPPPAPPPEAWGKTTPPVSVPVTPPPASPAPMPSAPAPKPPPKPAAPPPPAAPAMASAPAAAAPGAPDETVWKSKRAPAERNKLAVIYDLLFPEGTPRRRFGPYVLGVVVLFVLIIGKCALSPHGPKPPREPDPKTTGRLVVKSNLAGATFEAVRATSADDASTSTFSGTVEQPVAGLPPGKYAVTAKSEGWPDLHAEATLVAAQLTEVRLDFKGGSLRLDSDPTGASVRQGENDLGKTPLTIPLLPPGACQLIVDYPTWPPVTFKTTITAGVESTATVRLPHGKLIVESSPSGATVLLGRHALGQTPLTLPIFPAGPRKLVLQAKEFPPLELPVTVEDNGEVTVHPELGLAFPLLDPANLLRAVWVPDSADDTLPFDGLSGPSAPQNGVIHNLNRKRLYNDWLRKLYRYSGVVKSYNKETGTLEMAEQQNDYCHYHMMVKLSADTRANAEVVAQLTKGATFTFYGRLAAAEESRWISKSITFEFTSAEPLGSAEK